ncbi:unnamed protein product [Urochloa decumbens]|uniref:Laccase n=1 Tax=Urochloa decumbens TaxID=240449 RepID=A0ABC9GMJ6_9POAL
MKAWSLRPTEAAVVATTIFFFLSTMALPAATALVEHTFVVSQMKMTHLCKETLVTVVNGQLPGPTIEVTEGDSVAVHVVNKSPHNITIHWHGVKQRMNCWNDGVPMVTQCPIQPNQNFTYRFNVAGQEGTLWWHAHCFDSEGVAEDGYVLDVDPGKTYLLRIINTGLFSEFFLKIAGHRFTVVGSDANYVSPYTSDLIVIAPGETVDALVVADAPPGNYYMVAMPNQAPLPDTQTPEPSTRGMVRYKNKDHIVEGGSTSNVPVAPVMPDQHDVVLSLYFHSNLTSLQHQRHPPPPVPTRVDEHMFVTLGLGTVCRRGQTCNKKTINETILVATMNNVSFQLPTTPLLEAHYHHTGVEDALLELPDKPPRVFNFTDISLIPIGPKERLLETTSRATLARWFQYGSVVEIVFQGTAILQGDSNPMHLHGHDMFVLAQGIGNFDATKDVARYNLVNPPLKNTVVVPNLGWVAIRFVTNNPVFIVEDGPTVDTSLPPQPVDFPSCSRNIMPDEYYFQTPEIKVPRIDGL